MSKKPRKARANRARAEVRVTPAKPAANILWPGTLRARWSLSKPSLWRYERDGKLPPRDFRIGGRTGWKRSTIEAFEASGAQSP